MVTKARRTARPRLSLTDGWKMWLFGSKLPKDSQENKFFILELSFGLTCIPCGPFQPEPPGLRRDPARSGTTARTMAQDQRRIWEAFGHLLPSPQKHPAFKYFGLPPGLQRETARAKG